MVSLRRLKDSCALLLSLRLLGYRVIELELEPLDELELFVDGAQRYTPCTAPAPIHIIYPLYAVLYAVHTAYTYHIIAL